MFHRKRRVIAAKIETTIGTDVTPGATDGTFNAYNIDIQQMTAIEERESEGGFGRLPGVPGQKTGKVTFSVDLGWDGSGSPVWFDVLLPACGVVGSAGVYTPRSEMPGSNVKTVTIGVWEDGVLKKITGAMGNVKIEIAAGKMVRGDFEFTGAWSYTPTDTAIITPTYTTEVPLRGFATACTWDSVALKVAKVTIDLGNTIVLRESLVNDAAVLNAFVQDRYPKITCDPEFVAVATQARHTKWAAGTEAAFALTLDGLNSSTIAFAAPKAQILELKESHRNNLMCDEITFGCNKNGTTHDQELSITLTEG